MLSLVVDAVNDLANVPFSLQAGQETEVASCVLIGPGASRQPCMTIRLRKVLLPRIWGTIDFVSAFTWYEVALAHGDSSDFRALFPLAALLQSGRGRC